MVTWVIGNARGPFPLNGCFQKWLRCPRILYFDSVMTKSVVAWWFSKFCWIVLYILRNIHDEGIRDQLHSGPKNTSWPVNSTDIMDFVTSILEKKESSWNTQMHICFFKPLPPMRLSFLALSIPSSNFTLQVWLQTSGALVETLSRLNSSCCVSLSSRPTDQDEDNKKSWLVCYICNENVSVTW